jgi:hypothetical protein
LNNFINNAKDAVEQVRGPRRVTIRRYLAADQEGFLRL